MYLVSSIVTTVLLFFLATIVPALSFTLPIYKIKKMRIFTSRERLIINLASLLIIWAVSPVLTYFYLGFFMVIEILWYIFENTFKGVKKFDRIVITSLVTTFFMCLMVYSIKDLIGENAHYLVEVYEKNLQISHTQTLAIFENIKENYLNYIFFYSILTVFMGYVALDIRNYENWKISFEWILLYIGCFFMMKVMKINNFYVNNIMEIAKLIFIFFGIKSFYALFVTKFKYRGLSNMLAIILALLLPFGTFIFGVFEGFGIDTKVKGKNRKI